jgi:nicotinamide riboside kinase
MSRRNIYIIGAQSTGKSTLVNALKSSYALENVGDVGQPHIIREIARTVLKAKSFTREDITNSPSRAFELQRHILDAQREAEASASNDASYSWYICDRSGLDPIVYAQLFVGKDAADVMMTSEAWRELKCKMRAGIVMLCEAGCSWLIDDGIRLMPDDVDAWMRVDAAFRALLAAQGISYTVVSKEMISLQERVNVVRMAVEGGEV